MSDPYLTPNAELLPTDTAIKSLGWLFWLVAVTTTVLSILLGIIGTFVIPQFAELFTQFGSDLPASTLFVIEARDYLWIATLCAVTIWVYLWKTGFYCNSQTKIFRQLFLFLGMVDVFLIVGVLYALYAPIFVTSEAVP